MRTDCDADCLGAASHYGGHAGWASVDGVDTHPRVDSLVAIAAQRLGSSHSLHRVCGGDGRVRLARVGRRQGDHRDRVHNRVVNSTRTRSRACPGADHPTAAWLCDPPPHKRTGQHCGCHLVSASDSHQGARIAGRDTGQEQRKNHKRCLVHRRRRCTLDRRGLGGKGRAGILLVGARKGRRREKNRAWDLPWMWVWVWG
jgi:hypothetical protein